ncbi:MAG: LysM peptidoglycan-binding domain-containing protein [Arenicellales bacterium]|nr:LysM peptidoglycan-binding domain-containing protein [Arenicellales bacterium]MDP6551802.1 LysM peptidoglycan-binding domain-containing protein [Arenicellales bacterium]MDP6791658.1 LysM peptidoglycan-binding domain-containing protein [Arenicellales bacterium]MDP6919650.1 LysM peptidoglycan-binding domain-containing protein [Arenicellales bacterium]
MRMNTTPIRTLLALVSIAAVATGCVTAKPNETEAGAATAAAPAPAVSMAPAVVAAVDRPDDWCDRYPDSFECEDASAKATTSDDWCARYPDSFVCKEEVASGQTSSEDWCARYPDSFVCKDEAPVPAISAYVVQAGDHLWGIASQPKVYGDPYQWPLLFKRNRPDINDADLIYPGQMIQIERDLSDFQVQEAINHARTRGAWALGVVEGSDLRYLQAAGASDASNATTEQAAAMIAQAGAEVKAAKAASAVWRILDPAIGGSAVPLDKALKAAQKQLDAGDAPEAFRLAQRVSESAQLGIAQAAQQANAGPTYN